MDPICAFRIRVTIAHRGRWLGEGDKKSMGAKVVQGHVSVVGCVTDIGQEFRHIVAKPRVCTIVVQHSRNCEAAIHSVHMLCSTVQHQHKLCIVPRTAVLPAAGQVIQEHGDSLVLLGGQHNVHHDVWVPVQHSIMLGAKARTRM